MLSYNIRAVRIAALATALAATTSVALAQLTNEEAVKAKLESEGYKDVHDVNFGPEGITLKATKDGQEWRIAIDSSGKVMERR